MERIFKRKLYDRLLEWKRVQNGDIAKEEIAFVKEMAQDDNLYKDINVEEVLYRHISEKNKKISCCF